MLKALLDNLELIQECEEIENINLTMPLVKQTQLLLKHTIVTARGTFNSTTHAALNAAGYTVYFTSTDGLKGYLQIPKGRIYYG